MTDFIGIDFGTSNCVVAGFDRQNKTCLVPLEGDSPQMRTTMFIKDEEDLHEHITDADIELARKTIILNISQDKRRVQQEINDIQMNLKKHKLANSKYGEVLSQEHQNSYQLLRDSLNRNKASYKRLDDMGNNESLLDARARRFALSTKSHKERTIKELISNGEILFGQNAFRSYLADPESGSLFNSPKNFLGVRLSEQKRNTFTLVVTQFMRYIKQRADSYLQNDIKKVVLAKPVNYHNGGNPTGNEQAIHIMRQAAILAGFDEVEFIDEPVAAALSFEQTLSTQKRALIVDIGGGTTDLTYANLGSSLSGVLDRSSDILSTAGGRFGGMALDRQIGVHIIAPYFGKPTKTNAEIPIPNTTFSGLFAIDDLPTMSEFYSKQNTANLKALSKRVKNPHCFARTLYVQRFRLSHRIMNSIDMTKQALSEKQSVTMPLNYIEKGLAIPLSNNEIQRAFTNWHGQLRKELDGVVKNKEVPELIFLTGGMSLSPLVQKAISSRFPNTPQIQSDAFGAVAKGALVYAELHFGNATN